MLVIIREMRAQIQEFLHQKQSSSIKIRLLHDEAVQTHPEHIIMTQKLEGLPLIGMMGEADKQMSQLMLDC